MTNHSFDNILAPMSRDLFLTQYWNTSFVRVEGEKGRFSALPGWAELNSILETYPLPPPRLRLIQAGKTLDLAEFGAASQGAMPVHGGALMTGLARGATLVLNNVETLAGPVEALCKSFEGALQALVTANLYASWRSENGFDLHWDDQDTMILQLAGRKRWQVHAPTRMHPLHSERLPPPRPSGEPAWDGILEDGDILYLPRGWWHMAFPLEEPSLHLTVTIVPPNGMGFLKWLAEELVSQTQIRADVPLASEAREGYFAELQRLLAEASGGDAPARFLEAQAARRPIRHHLQLPNSVYKQFSPLTGESRLRLSGVRKLIWVKSEAPGTACFLAGGTHWSCPQSIRQALDNLSSEASRSVDELRNSLSDAGSRKSLMRLLTALATAGAVLVET